jgi:hypothetical protein
MADRRLYYKLNQAQHLLSKRVDAELAGALGIKTAQLGAVFFRRWAILSYTFNE